MDSIPGSGRSPGEGNGHPLQYSCLGNPMDRGACWATVHGISQARILEWLPFPSPGDLPNPGIKPGSPTLQADALLSEVRVKVTQSCLTLCDLMNYSPPVSSVHGILQAGILEWVAISFSRGSSRPRDRTWVSRIPGRCFNL